MTVNKEFFDEDGNPSQLKESYHINRTPPVIIRTEGSGTETKMELPPQKVAKLLKWAVHTLELYWWGEDFCWSDEEETSDESSDTWRVHVEYRNGEVQDTVSKDVIPGPVMAFLERLSEITDITLEEIEE